MKITNLIAAAAVAISALAFTNKSEEFKVDKQQSKLTWVGRKVTGEHTGTINISDGKLISDGKNIVGGSFSIDMTSITDKDLTNETYNQKLVDHLKSDDFFSTGKHPVSTFVITRITPAGKDQYNVKGSLTIKGISKDLEFPATIQSAGNQVKASARIKVDRTRYDIRYGSGSFFDNLGDKAIDNEFELNIDLVASK